MAWQPAGETGGVLSCYHSLRAVSGQVSLQPTLATRSAGSAVSRQVSRQVAVVAGRWKGTYRRIVAHLFAVVADFGGSLQHAEEINFDRFGTVRVSHPAAPPRLELSK